MTSEACSSIATEVDQTVVFYVTTAATLAELDHSTVLTSGNWSCRCCHVVTDETKTTAIASAFYWPHFTVIVGWNSRPFAMQAAESVATSDDEVGQHCLRHHGLATRLNLCYGALPTTISFSTRLADYSRPLLHDGFCCP